VGRSGSAWAIYNTAEEVDYLLEKLPAIIAKLRGDSPLAKHADAEHHARHPKKHSVAG